MAGCKIDASRSLQLQTLIATWKACGYPSVEQDLENAYKEIRKDIKACHCRKAARFSEVLGNFELLKYRQKDSRSKEGARGGWRIYALYDKRDGTLYPIIVYPKKHWTDAADDVIIAATKELIQLVKNPVLWASQTKPAEDRFRHQTDPDGQTRSLCLSCFDVVVVSFSSEEVSKAESEHDCSEQQR